MPEPTKPNKEQTYTIHTTGGERLHIKAHDIFINEGENRVYFLDSEGQIKKEWVVFVSGVAAIHNRSGEVRVGQLHM